MLIAMRRTTRRCKLCKMNLIPNSGYYVINTNKGKYVCEKCVDLIMSYLITCYAIQNNKVN